MAHLFQVGVGSGGMPVLDLVARDPRITKVSLVEPDLYKAHNVVRHLFPHAAVGKLKVELARDWLLERRPDLEVAIFPTTLEDGDFDAAIAGCDLAICAVDQEPSKYRFDSLMRKHQKPWTLGEVLSGGIAGFVHGFVPGGPCYGCIASHLQREVVVDRPTRPDYSQPGGPIQEATIPASKASIAVIAALHAQLTLQMLDTLIQFDPGFTSLLFTLQQVPGVFAEAYRPYRFRIAKSPTCLVCGVAQMPTGDLDSALDAALARFSEGSDAT